MRHRLGKQGHDNPAFIDDSNLNPKSKADDNFAQTNIDAIIAENEKGRMQIAKRNRRSRRLQKKNSLDVQFRRRFSMLRDNNAAANNIYNESESAFNAMDMDGGRESRTSSMMPNLGPRASSGNLSTKILDKRFNKMLFNMHGIPVKPNVITQNHKKSNQKNNIDQPQQDYFNLVNQQTSKSKLVTNDIYVYARKRPMLQSESNFSDVVVIGNESNSSINNDHTNEISQYICINELKSSVDGTPVLRKVNIFNVLFLLF